MTFGKLPNLTEAYICMHTPKVKASRGSIASEHLGKGVVFVEMEPGSNREPRVPEEDALSTPTKLNYRLAAQKSCPIS